MIEQCGIGGYRNPTGSSWCQFGHKNSCPSADTTPIVIHSDYSVHDDIYANYSDHGVHSDAEASRNQIMSKSQEQTQDNKSVEHEQLYLYRCAS